MNIALPQAPVAGGRNLLTHSRMSCAKTCLRRHYYAYEMGVRRDRQSTPLRMGSAFHVGLDLWAQGRTADEAIAAVTAGYEELPAWANTDDLVTEWMLEREIVARMLSGYFWRWGGQAGEHGGGFGFEVLASELAFDLPIVNPETGGATQSFRFAGKIDKIVRLTDGSGAGRLAVMEHKTAGESIASDCDYWKRLRLDQQISGYVLAARRLGYDVETVLYDATRKPEIAPKLIPKKDRTALESFGLYFDEKIEDIPEGQRVPDRETVQMYGARLTADIAERPDFYFNRVEIPRLEADLAEFGWELWQIQQDLRECQRTGRWYRNTAACLHPYKCEYFDLCVNGYDPAAGVPSGYVRIEHVHPELASDAGAAPDTASGTAPGAVSGAASAVAAGVTSQPSTSGATQ